MLPYEIPAYKNYTLPVIETCCSVYTDPGLPLETLRRTVKSLGDGHPHHSALHGWLGGLGAKALGRLDTVSEHLPVSSLLAETQKRLKSDLFDLWSQTIRVSDRKYTTLQRYEQLEACARVFHTAKRVFPKSLYPFNAWERWLQGCFHVSAWCFPARFYCTDLQQHVPGGDTIQSSQSTKKHRKRKKERKHGARSPP